MIRLNLSPRECAANEPAEMDPFALDHIPGTIALEQLPWIIRLVHSALVHSPWTKSFRL